jgi:hypothetical protein
MPRSSAVAPSLAIVAVLLFAPAVQGWDAIPDEELASKVPLVEKDADAEALFWEIRAEDVIEGAGNKLSTHVRHHLRIRVFTDRGKEVAGRVDIPYWTGLRIRNIEARTVLPDGTSLPVKASDVFERVLVRKNREQLRAYSFSFPSVVPGAILEYHWLEVRHDEGMNTVLFLQRDLPVQRLTCRLKPLLFQQGPAFRYTTHRTALSSLRRDAEGYFTGKTRNVPAYREEPLMPSEVEVKGWIGTYYVEKEREAPSEFWARVSRFSDDLDRRTRSGSRAIRDLAVRVAGDAPDDEQKLGRLYQHCARSIHNLSTLRGADAARINWPNDLDEVLQRGEGSGGQINRLFESLARAIGYDARIARVADKERTFFEENSLIPWLLNTTNVAVRTGEGWKFYDPGSFALPAGMLRWQEEGQRALIPDPKELIWAETPQAPCGASLLRRYGDFALATDGSLEGDAMWELSGHLAIEEKLRDRDLDVAGREEALRAGLRERMPSAEVSQIRFRNADNHEHPVEIRFHLRVPDFAQVTGRRLFFQPAVFQKGVPARFTDERRTHAIDFRFSWMEYDSLLLRIPEGYAFDHPEAPGNFAIGDLGDYRVRMGIADEGRLLVFRREFWFEGTRFGREQYGVLRQAFATVHEHDQHPLAVQRGDGNGP